jgi:hypothetical protein
MTDPIVLFLVGAMEAAMITTVRTPVAFLAFAAVLAFLGIL